MLLGNPDRLPCEALGWRGNPHNILYCQGGSHAGRMVAIDSAVQRRPPGMPATHACCPCDVQWIKFCVTALLIFGIQACSPLDQI